ncbi:MAG TPA: hypothetical protein VG275_07710 [Solirubrobacteraceae bacterium]|nr:hypothetical protein [Solirubrobacteraceae bacterium]
MISSFRLSLPRGLSFTKNHARLAAGVSITGAHDYTLSRERGGLEVRIPVRAETLQVQIRARALIETKAFVHHVRTLGKPAPVRPVAAFRASLQASDITGSATVSTLTFFVT